MRFSYFLISTAATGVALASVAAPAVAQVTERTRLEDNRAEDAESARLEPVGARVGAFKVLPRVEVGALWDDNVYATDTNEQSDTVYRVAPSMNLTADTSRYRWNIRADLEHLEFDKFDDESRTNYGVGTTLATEIVRDTKLRGRLNYDVSHEDRGDPNSLQSNVEPVKFKTLDTGLSFERTVSRIIIGADVDYRTLDFNDVGRVNGTVENNDDRDREFISAGGKLGYELSPGYSLLVRAVYSKVDYDESVDDFGFDRDSDGFRVTGGIAFELTRILTGEVFGGYLQRNYDDARYKTIKEPTYGAAITWSPTELSTVRLSADRTVEETIFAGYQAYISTSANLRVEHELTRQIALNGGLRYAKFDYVRNVGSVAPNRKDDNYGASVGVRYTLNRLLYGAASYEWSSREANVPDTDYDRNKFVVTLGAQF